MHRADRTLLLSATDLSNFLGCRHRTALDLAVADDLRERPWAHNPLLKILKQRGIEHEQRYVASLRAFGLAIADLGTIEDHEQRAIATRDAMHKGVDVIVQGALAHGAWHGLPDVMRRVARSSALGPWSYEIADTKLACETRAGTMLQLGLYSDMLALAQGARPECFHVVTPNPKAATGGAPLPPTDHRVLTYRVDDYAAYFRWIRDRMIEMVAIGAERLAAQYYPDPVPMCQVCQWDAECGRRRRADDHLSLVAGISALQRHELESRSITTLTALATLPLPIPFKPKRGSLGTYVRAREQARLQHESRGLTPPRYELLEVEPDRGLCRLPEPTPGDLYLDLEGDPLAVEGGREYLFGIVAADGTYRARWALDDAAERHGFEWVIDAIEAAVRVHPDMHVYHYAPYEPAALKRLMGRHVTRERELDAMLRAGRFVDLFGVTRQALRAGVERYSIKNLEPLYDFRRAVDLAEANRCLSYVEQALELGSPDAVSPQIREVVEGYNRDDCQSALRLREWLDARRASLIARGVDVPRQPLASGDAPESVDERARRVEALRARLLEGIPESKADRSAVQQGRWLLAYMLDYHRREQKSTWWEYFRLCDLDEEELVDERGAVVGLELVERIERVLNKRTKRPTGSVVDRYRYPPQEMEIDTGDNVRVQDPSERGSFGVVMGVDRPARTIDMRKSRPNADRHPPAFFAFTHVPTDTIEDALERIAESVASGHDGFGAARALLAAEPPRLLGESLVRPPSESAGDLAVRVVGALNRTVLAVQGPPGSGKTYCGARMICALVRQGKRVGVTATSHSVIRKLLEETAKAAAGAGTAVRLAHKVGDDDHGVTETDCVHLFDDNARARDTLVNGEVDVMGGTAWFWARPELASTVDVLFVDEAGQMALPNVVAVSQAANSIVLLGDPRQLEQPQRGSHPDGVDVSALEHILGERQTIPDDRGLFLPETWRLAPAICDFTSELFYENRLAPHAGLERQRITGAQGLPESGLVFVPVEHDGSRNASDDEVEVVAALVARLTAAGTQWIDGDGHTHRLSGTDVLVTAPYNAQVNRLADRLAATGARVGTVDRFQGQEAAVAIYSMTTSRPEDAPRGLEFLYSLNRLNVATSRARCLAVVVASPRLFEAECQTPRQMKLANGLCRYRELAAEVRLQ